jgi:Mn2+/Fe2+ NRAMP family transporter
MAYNRTAQGQPEGQAVHANPQVQNDRELIVTARAKGRGALAKAFIKLSGPGWLQSGITIGGVSFSSSLYLGVLSGFTLLWLQPLVMILGIVMLSAISYVTLSSGQRPLRAINEHISPVLGWSWLFASMAANLVWSMPQFALGTAAIQQNLLPNLVGPRAMPDPWGRILVVSCFLAVCITVTMFYGAGARGVRIFEIIIKTIVSIIVLCFFGVVLKLSFKGVMDWGEAIKGLIPNPGFLFKPAEGFTPYLAAVTESCRSFWSSLIVSQQRDVMISAAAASVGVNMTFLLPYSMLRRGWDKDFRGLAIFDLSTGLFIPFVLATGFVVMASASRFYTVPAPGFVPDEQGGIVTVEAAQNLIGPYKALLKRRLAFEIGSEVVAGLSAEQLEQRVEALPYADKKMAAMLVKRDNFNLAKTLEPLTGPVVAQYIFGLGVMGLGLSAATVLMSINGLCLCELLKKPPTGWPQRLGALMVSVGALGAIFWKQPAPWLAIPTSAFCTVLLPIAYITFLIVMNQRSILGDRVPRGGKRILWNVLMALATAVATFISVWSLWSRLRWWGIIIIVAFVGLILVVHFVRKGKRQTAAA